MSFLDEMFGQSRSSGARCIGRAALLAAFAGIAPTAFAQNAGLGNVDAGEIYENSLDAVFQGADEGNIAPAGQGEVLDDLDFNVEVNEFDLVDLHVNNEDLAKVLQLLSIQSQRNIVASPNVSATVTADLYGVTFYEALEAILHVNGFGFQERGNFIYVYTREELAAIDQAARQQVSRVVTLSYLNAVDAAEFGKQLLSDEGSITTSVATDDFQLNAGTPTGADSFAHMATVVINDYEENVDAIVALLDELDARPAQVLVEATILQTTLNEANAFGVDFAILNNMNFTDFVGIGGPLSAVNGLIAGAGEDIAGNDVLVPSSGNGSAINSNIGNVEGNATFKAGIVNEDVSIFLRLLDEVTDVTVVSNPKILTLNRQPARVLVGTKVGYLNTTTTETATTQTVEFLDVGTELSVRPFVSDGGLIRLELTPKVSSAQLRAVTDNAGAQVTIPDEDTTELTTNVQLRDGQTAVLGGLFTETTTATRRQIPIFGDIPVIGNAFRGYDDDTRRSEIIFMITPSIVNDTQIAESGELAQDYITYARVGARKGTLPFSRDRQVGRLLIKARQLAEEGKRDEALFKVQRALALAPNSPDAHALRAKLSGNEPFQPTRSLMEGMLHEELIGGLDDGQSAGIFGEPEFNEPRFVEPAFDEPVFVEPMFTDANEGFENQFDQQADPAFVGGNTSPNANANGNAVTVENAPGETFESFDSFNADPAFEEGESVTAVPGSSEADAADAFESQFNNEFGDQFGNGFSEPAASRPAVTVAPSNAPAVAVWNADGTPAQITSSTPSAYVPSSDVPAIETSPAFTSTINPNEPISGIDQYGTPASEPVVVEEFVIGNGPRSVAQSTQSEPIDAEWLIETPVAENGQGEGWAQFQGMGVLMVPMPHGGMVQLPWPVNEQGGFTPYNGSFTTAPINSTDLSDDVNR
ncbi:MAG: hypothetical protein AAF995_03060 [Planctomycetota bacterium]